MLEIIYEDEWYVAINKPHGLLVHRTKIAEEKKEFEKLMEYGGDYFRLFEELELVQEQLSIIRFEKENLSTELDAQLTNKFVINKAVPSDKKAYPIRWLIVVFAGISTFLTTLITLYIRQTILNAKFN